MFLMVNLKFLEKVMLEKKTGFCLCKHCSLEKNTSVLWQPIPMFWDFCVIFMMFDSGRLIFGIFMGILWDFYGIVVVFDSGRPIFGIFMGFVWNFYGIVVGFCGVVVVFASGWPKTTEQIVELPWLHFK